MKDTTYRAVFANPYSGTLSRGKERPTLKAAMTERPERAEETHEFLVGIESREVTPWVPVSLTEILDANK